MPAFNLKGENMESFWKTMQIRAKAWLKQNAPLLLAVASILSPLLLILFQRLFPGPPGTWLGLAVCFIVQAILNVFRHFYAWLKERTDMPKPDKRFTREEDDGEVTVEYSRLQELILFMDSYENWLEDNGLVGDKENGS